VSVFARGRNVTVPQKLLNDLAYEAKISRSYLSQLEKGVYHASIKIIGKLAVKLGAEPDEFLKRPAAKKARR
jgi:transcriptional regulator with XRE-family HTH domain